MIKTFQLATCLSKFAISATEGGLISKRLFSVTSELCRKLDSRAHPPYKLPSSKNKRWIEIKPIHELYKYTTDPLPIDRTGGRGPNGRIWNHKRGGGLKKTYFMIDHNRTNPLLLKEGQNSLTERIYEIKKDQNRSAFIALVASNTHKRYVVATENMKVGDLIVSTNEISKNPIRPTMGNSYPLGSLPVGTMVCCVELVPGRPVYMAQAAGVTVPLVRKFQDEDGNDLCVVRMPSKREVILSNKCQATVGRVSNIEHNKEHYGKAGAKRLAGIRPRSGRWHRKTGYHGRKIRATPPPVNMKPKKENTKIEPFKVIGSVGLVQKWCY